MQSVVEDVEEERENEGSPANSQWYQNSHGSYLMAKSFIISYSDDVPNFGIYQDHHRQAINEMSLYFCLKMSQKRPDLKNNYNGVVAELLYELWLMTLSRSVRIHHVLKINLVKAMYIKYFQIKNL